jgi:hypothetical protein
MNKALDRCADGLAPALPLSPRWMSSRLPEIWRTEEAARSWLREPRVADLLRRSSKGGNPNIITIASPPFERSSEGDDWEPPKICYWRQVEYRTASRRGGRPSRALVPNGADPVAAIAAALGIDPAVIVIAKQSWSLPSYREEPRSDA